MSVSIIGKYIRGALYDGHDIYLVEANRRVFQLYPFAGEGPLGDYGEILSVTNAGALYDVHVKEFKEIEPDVQIAGDIANFLKTYEIKTSKGICLISMKANVTYGDFGLALADYKGEPHADLRKLHDF
jgi:hypothetical protein